MDLPAKCPGECSSALPIIIENTSRQTFHSRVSPVSPYAATALRDSPYMVLETLSMVIFGNRPFESAKRQQSNKNDHRRHRLYGLCRHVRSGHSAANCQQSIPLAGAANLSMGHLISLGHDSGGPFSSRVVRGGDSIYLSTLTAIIPANLLSTTLLYPHPGSHKYPKSSYTFNITNGSTTTLRPYLIIDL